MFSERYFINSVLIIYLSTMRTLYNVIGLSLGILLISSCVRKNETIEPAAPPQGGKGGHVTLAVTAQHHEKNLTDARIFIKYASTTAPADTMGYDEARDVGVVNGRPGVVFDSLKQGDYYIFALGQDDSVIGNRFNLYGGATYKVVDTLHKTYDVYIAINNELHHK